jgi:hypothetical protein
MAEEKGGNAINLQGIQGRRSPGRYFFLLASKPPDEKISTQRTPEEREL